MPPITPTPNDYDRMYHALGRPASPIFGGYRNRYAVMVGSPEDHRIEALAARHGWWRFLRYAAKKLIAAYAVTEHGRRALMAWMIDHGPGVPAQGRPNLTQYGDATDTAAAAQP